jgi:AmmeMemoRadiSam system protein A
MLSAEQKRIALRVAREAVLVALQRLEPPLPEIIDEEVPGRFGVFVSLRNGKELRGCIGVVDPTRPLFQSIAACSVSAATTDARFPPVTLGEISSIRFEISVLSPPRRIQGPEEIEIGRHGVIVTLAGRTALLLPQVATQEGWSASELLSAACSKAGLPPAAWRGGAMRLEAFTAEVFREDG